MDINTALARFIIDEVLPIEKDPFSRSVLGGLAAAVGTSLLTIKWSEGLDLNKKPEELHSIIKGAFEAQPTITISLSDLLPENINSKYPIIQLPRVKKTLEKPYDIDLETVERFMSLLAQN